MKELIIVIAGIAVAISGDEKAAPLLTPLKGLFRGFLLPRGDAATEVALSYENFVHLRKFKAEPLRISTAKDRETTRIINHVAKRYPISEKTLLIGFLNGVLAYNVHSHKFHIFLFRSKGENFLMGSLYKLLFILTSLLMVDNKRLLVHGAGLRINRQGNLFLGLSGAGKSTVAGYVPIGDVLSDDATVVEERGGLFKIHPSPFSQINSLARKGKNHYRQECPLARIIFLKKAEPLALNRRDRQAALAELLLFHIHYFNLMDRELKTSVFNCCCDLCASIPSFDMHFQKDNSFLTLL
ncbi:MAG: hypothetical protein K0B01_06995 [Syntrophobacterales bacterium]|nr:hypothetical protein [Syntrophobacterales bacterium]